MTVKSKYDPGDTIWVVNNRTAQEAVVRSVHTLSQRKDLTMVSYAVSTLLEKRGESEVYPSREALLKANPSILS